MKEVPIVSHRNHWIEKEKSSPDDQDDIFLGGNESTLFFVVVFFVLDLIQVDRNPMYYLLHTKCNHDFSAFQTKVKHGFVQKIIQDKRKRL